MISLPFLSSTLTGRSTSSVPARKTATGSSSCRLRHALLEPLAYSAPRAIHARPQDQRCGRQRQPAGLPEQSARGTRY